MTAIVEAARYGWTVRLRLTPDVALAAIADLALEIDQDDRWNADIHELASAQRDVRTCHLGDYRDLLDEEGGSWEEATDAALERRDVAFRPFAEAIGPLPTLDLTPQQARDMAHALLVAADQVSPTSIRKFTADAMETAA
jgi:hypothetical protein